MKQEFKLLICLIMAVTCPSAWAQQQSTADALEQINNIKLDSKYIWAEGTSTKNKKEALSNAQAVLKFEIQNWLNQSGLKDLSAVVIPSNDQYMKIETERRKVHRAFVYVSKEQIMPIGKNEKIIVVERQKPEHKKPEKTPELVSAIEEIYTPTEFEKDMLTVKLFSEIEPFISDHHISKTGKYRNRPQSGSYYIFIYNREEKVLACLKVSDDKIINVATGKSDGLENYKGCGGLWFIPNN